MSIRLEIEPAYRAALEAAGLMSFDAFMNAKAGPPVSKHRHRETVPLEIEVDRSPKKFYLKRVFRVPPAHSILPWLRFRSGYSQPAREWAACKMMREAGLPAMERVAFGERRSFGVPVQAFILVAASPYRHTLEEWLTPGFERPSHLSPEVRGELIESVSILAHQIDAAGYFWPDADAKHVFAERAANESGLQEWRFCLIDLERLCRKQDWIFYEREPFRLIFRSMSPLRLCRADLRRIEAPSGLDSGDLDNAEYASMEASEGTLLDDGLRPAEPLRHPRQNHLEKLNDILVSPRSRDALVATGLTSLDAVFRLETGHHLSKPGLAGHRDRILLELDQGGGRKFTAFLKRYRRPPLREQLRRIRECGFKRSTARLEARLARRLTEIGIGTLSVIAHGQEMSRIWEKRSFIITEFVPGESLEKAAARVAEGSLSFAPTDKFEMIRQLAALAQRMHGEGYFHRDFYLCHVFLDRNPGGEVVFRVIDLGRMIRRRSRLRRWRIKDLAALNYSAPAGIVTRADRLRFLYYYVGGPAVPGDARMSKSEKRGLIEAVTVRTRRMAAHDAKRAARHQRSQNKA